MDAKYLFLRIELWLRGLLAVRQACLQSRGWRRLKSVASFLSIVAQQACLGWVAFQVLVFAVLGFHLELAAREWGRFLTHFADAAPSARLPVVVFILMVVGILSLALSSGRSGFRGLIGKLYRATGFGGNSPSTPKGGAA